MTAKTDLLRALENTDGPEDAVRAEVLTVARRRKMSAEAIIRAGTDIGATPRPTSERPLTVEEAVTSLVQHFLSAARAAQSRLDENEEDQAIQQDECEGVEVTVSTHATHDHTHKGSLGETLADGNPRLEEASNKELFSMIQRLVSTLDEERIASKDRELRLNQKINELSAQVESLTERLTDLGKETQARDEKLTRRVNDVKACVMSAYSNTPTRTRAHSPTRDTLTAHAETNAYTAAATYSEATQSNPGRQRRSSADPLTDQVTEQKRTTPIVSSHEKTQRHPTRAQANTCRRAEQPQWNTDDGDEDEDDQLWTLVAGKKPTGKKAVIYVGNLKIGAKDNEVTEYIKRRCEKLCIRPPTIHNCKIFEKDAEEGEIVEFCGARLTIDQGPLETICDRQFWPGRSYARPWVFRDRETSKENTNAK